MFLRRRRKDFPMKKNSVFNAMIKVNDVIGNIERLFCVAVMILLVVACMIFISCRYVIHISVPWSDELARYVLVALGWIGASYCSYHDDHLRINAVSSLVKKYAGNPTLILTALEMVTQLLIGVYMAFFLSNFIGYLKNAVMPLNVLTTALKIPNWYPMLVIVLGSALIVIHSFLKSFVYLGKLLGAVPMEDASTEAEEG